VWEKFQVFFMSQGLVYSLTKTSRVLYLASLLLFIPALLGIYSAGSVSAFNDRLVELKDLRVQVSRDEFEKAKQQLGEPQNKLSKEDEQAIDEVAKQYEQTVVPFTMPASMRATTFVTRSTLVRETILKTATARENASKPNNAEWVQNPSGTQVEDLTPLEKKVVDMPEKAAASREPVTPQGRQMRDDLQDLAKRSPTIRERIVKFGRSFKTQALPEDLLYAMVNHIASDIAAETPRDFGDLLRGIQLKPIQVNARSDNEARSSEFLKSIMSDRDLDEAFRMIISNDKPSGFMTDFDRVEYQNAMRTVTEKIPFADISQKFTDKPPSVKTKPEKIVDMETAVASVEGYNNVLSKSEGLRNKRSNADAIMDFTDLFPGQLGEETKTFHGQIIKKWRPDDPLLPSPNKPKPPNDLPPLTQAETASRHNFERTRNYDSLKGFSRVGGVLIGKSPSDVSENNPSKLNFTDLKWELTNKGLNFILFDANGNQLRSRSFRSSIAYQALNYASDGRLTTVTIIGAEPISKIERTYLREFAPKTDLTLTQKVFLHPTLVDTPLGYRIIKLDQFINIFRKRNDDFKKASDEAMERVEYQKCLYEFVWAERFSVLFENQYDSKSLEGKKVIDELIADRRQCAAKALQDTKSINDPAKSPLSVKKEFFDQELVKVLAGVPNGTSLEKISEFIRSKARKQLDEIVREKNDEKTKNLLKKWQTPPPDFTYMNGVRERNFSADINQIFVSEGREIPMPFDFLTEITFTTPPAFIDESKAENYNDVQPWEFPLLRDKIQTTVMEEIKKDTGAQEILNDACEFTMLQRLFRMALNGQLGENFPVERMIELSNALAENAPDNYYRTLRWNATIPPATMKKISESNIEGGEDIYQLYNALGISKDYDQVVRERSMPLPPME